MIGNLFRKSYCIFSIIIETDNYSNVYIQSYIVINCKISILNETFIRQKIYSALIVRFVKAGSNEPEVKLAL